MAARLRFSSSRGTTSATVPTATTSRYGPQRERQLDAVVAPVFEQRVGQLERHADAGQVGERIAPQLGVDDDAVGQLPDGLVVVGDDHVEAELAGVLDLGVRADPAVDRYDEAGAGGGELVERLGGDAVALA